MSKGIRIRGVRADGSFNADAVLVYVFGDLGAGNKPYLDETGEPLATARLRPVTRDQVRRLQKKHSRVVANPAGGYTQDLDKDAYTGELVDLLILSWEGVLAEDGEPLSCTSRAKLRLGDDRLADMLAFASKNEVLEEASFREPASIL